MRKILVIVVLMLLASGLNALPEFDYSSYTLPDYSVKGLEFRIPGLGFKAISFDGDSRQDYQTNIDMSLDGTYFVNYYRQKWEFDYQAGGGFSYSLDKNENHSTHDRDFNTMLNFNGRYYFGDRVFIIGQENFGYEDSKTNLEGGVSKSHRTMVVALIGAGYGRIYNLATMRQAQAIVDELYSAGLLTRYPNQAGLAALGDLLYEIQTGRVLDSRLKRIEDFNRIDAFLNEQGLLKEESMAYFAILNDIMSYANIGIRSTGSRIQLLFGAVQSKSFSRYFWDEIENREESGPLYMVSAEAEKILSRYWQWGLFLGWQTQNSERVLTGEPDRACEMSASGVSSDLTWYPDTRTRMSFMGEAVYQTNREDVNGTRVEDEYLLSLSLACDADYYFSPHLLLNGRIALRNHKLHDEMSGDNISSVGTTMSLQLIYKVF